MIDSPKPPTEKSPTFKCFVIMPFSDTVHTSIPCEVTITAAQWTHVYERWIKKAVESFAPHRFRCVRSPAVPGNFIKGIVRDLYDSDLVIADLTGSRPNVYYELGIRHALETGTIMITQDLASVPSDLRSYYCFKYVYKNEHHLYDNLYAAFENDLHEKMAHIFDNLTVSDNPVSDFIGHKNAFIEERCQKEKLELVFLAERLSEVVEKNYAMCEALLQNARGEKPKPDVDIIFDFYPFDMLLSRFVNTRWEFMPLKMLADFNTFLSRIRYTFLPVHQQWQVIQINRAPEECQHFHDLLAAVMADRPGNEREAVGDIIQALRDLPISITHHPKVGVQPEK